MKANVMLKGEYDKSVGMFLPRDTEQTGVSSGAHLLAENAYID
jgi:hypothetical protein